MYTRPCAISPIRAILNITIAALTRTLRTDGNPVGDAEAANVFGADRKHTITRVKQGEQIKGVINFKLNILRSIVPPIGWV